jgi:hypothetical protein
MSMKSIIVGEVEITALTDVEGPFFRLGQLFPGARAEQWGSMRASTLGRSRTPTRCTAGSVLTC